MVGTDLCIGVGATITFILKTGLLPTGEIDEIVASAAAALIGFEEAQAHLPVEACRTMGAWLADFQRAKVAIEADRATRAP